MLLNADKNLIFNTTLSKSANFVSDILVGDVLSLLMRKPKLLSIIFDESCFSSHVDDLIQSVIAGYS